MAHQYIKWLCVNTKLCHLKISIFFTYRFLYFTIVRRCYPFFFRDFRFIVNVQSNNDIIFTQPFQYFRIRPNIGLHFSTIYTTVSCKIDKNGFVLLLSTCYCLIIIEVTFQSMRQMQKFVIFWCFTNFLNITTTSSRSGIKLDIVANNSIKIKIVSLLRR